MAVEEIGIPSGFSADKASIGNILNLKRIETANKKVILYFDEVTVIYIFFNSLAWQWLTHLQMLELDITKNIRFLFSTERHLFVHYYEVT